MVMRIERRAATELIGEDGEVLFVRGVAMGMILSFNDIVRPLVQFPNTPTLPVSDAKQAR